MSTFCSFLRNSSHSTKQIRSCNAAWFKIRSFSSEISIPKRIPRGPTDILRTLESTIDRDPTAAHYKYHDDPYLIPTTNYTKRVYAMSQESGRKAAHWIRQQHPELFQHKEADPFIKSFAPKLSFNENSEVTETDLINVIDDVQVSDAILVYKLLQRKNVKLSQETHQKLLELLCFYNADDALSEEFIEEKWFRQSTKGKENLKKTWKDGGLAEEIFISMDNPSVEAYSAIIQGMAKYFQTDRAMELFEEAKQKGLVLSTDVYNALIKIVPVLKEGFDLRWSFVVDLLTQISKAKLKPNLGTLNATLEVLSTMGGGSVTKDNMLKTLAVFKKLGIEPSLASWYYVLITFCKERGPKSGVLINILDEIENKEFKAQDSKDTFFFVTAMDVCRYHLKSKDVAERVHKLLHFGNNYDLIGDSYKESIYYRHYVSILCSQLPTDEFMEKVYMKLVPHIYVPEPSVQREILESVEAGAALEYIPRLWQDIVIFDHARRRQILESILNIMAENEPPTDFDLNQKFANIALDILKRIENREEEGMKENSFPGDLFGNIILVLLRNKDFKNACYVMEKLGKGKFETVGVPKLESLSLFVDHCIENKEPSKAIDCIQYCSESGYADIGDLAIRLIKSLTLDESHLDRLSKIVGPDILHQKESVS